MLKQVDVCVVERRGGRRGRRRGERRSYVVIREG